MTNKKNDPLPLNWKQATLEDLLNYIQPTKYIVESTDYDDKYKTPVLTAGKSFIKGYTNERRNIFNSLPVIIFDDFTTAIQFVNFSFKVKSSAMKILKPTCSFVNIRFVFHYMNTINIRADTHKRYWISIYSKIPIQLPPQQEQTRIVEKIEELLSSLDKGVEDLKKAREQLKVYRQAVLKYAFEGKLTEEWRKQNNPEPASKLLERIKEEREVLYRKKLKEWEEACKKTKKNGVKKPAKPKPPNISKKLNEEDKNNNTATPNSWEMIRFVDLIKYEKDAIKRGPFGSAIKKSFFVPTGYKVYEQKNAIYNNAELGDYFIDDKKYQELDRFSVKPGDYIISCSGTIGRIAKLPKSARLGVINQALLKIVLDENLLISKYFLHLFRSAIFQQKVLKETRGSAMKNIASVDDIKDIPLLLPSKVEQIQILNEIESRLSVCDKVEETIEQSLRKVESLRQSILKKAFEGKLVPQDPNDEPAAKLLKRIKEEKSKLEDEQKAKKKPKKIKNKIKNPRRG